MTQTCVFTLHPPSISPVHTHTVETLCRCTKPNTSVGKLHYSSSSCGSSSSSCGSSSSLSSQAGFIMRPDVSDIPSLPPCAAIINHQLVRVTGAASAGQKQVEVAGSSYHGEKNMSDRIVCQSRRQPSKPAETRSSEEPQEPNGSEPDVTARTRSRV